MVTIDYIFDAFQITAAEYAELDAAFGKLCLFAAHQLKKNNSRNNVTDDLEDIAQELRLAITRAGVYTKRQCYLESCMAAAGEHVSDEFVRLVLAELRHLWDNRTRHGANRQRFGEYQEQILETIVRHHVPVASRPDKARRLQIDGKFKAYCKAIAWNCCRNLGKKITRERQIRTGLVSISQHDFLTNEKI